MKKCLKRVFWACNYENTKSPLLRVMLKVAKSPTWPSLMTKIKCQIESKQVKDQAENWRCGGICEPTPKLNDLTKNCVNFLLKWRDDWSYTCQRNLRRILNVGKFSAQKVLKIWENSRISTFNYDILSRWNRNFLLNRLWLSLEIWQQLLVPIYHEILECSLPESHFDLTKYLSAL